jgi:glutaminase
MSNINCQLVKDVLQQVFDESKGNRSGNVADYIPQLANCNPDLFGVSFCDVHGKVTSIGDVEHEFCLQSCVKPLTYCLARRLHTKSDGVDCFVHKHVGYEPSGRSFNEFALNNDGLPHNPLINSGAIMVASLIQPHLEPSGRFDASLEFVRNMSGENKISFDNAVFLSERHHADRNLSLAYYMRENKAFSDPQPTPSQLSDHLDLYFQCCSLSTTSTAASIIAATLANRGTCPTTKKEVVSPAIVMDALAIMHTCGMYDYSGQFSFEIGLPAKSGVSGCVLLVIPNVGGLCIYSPRLGKHGNSVRALDFCRNLSNATKQRFHMYGGMKHLMFNCGTASQLRRDVSTLISAAASGDIDIVKSVSHIDVLNSADYDGRTALHLACAEGQLEVVSFLVDATVNINVQDRFGSTPVDEASKLENGEIKERIIMKLNSTKTT